MGTVRECHAPDARCDGCVELFGWGFPENLERIEHRNGYEVVWRRKVTDYVVRWRKVRTSGQAIVEFALVLPLVMFLLLGFAEVGVLLSQREAWGRDAANAAALVASGREPDGQSAMRALDAASGCTPATVNGDPVVRVTLSCSYRPMVSPFFDGLAVTVSAEAVKP